MLTVGKRGRHDAIPDNDTPRCTMICRIDRRSISIPAHGIAVGSKRHISAIECPDEKPPGDARGLR
jgi:hypothetical protein